MSKAIELYRAYQNAVSTHRFLMRRSVRKFGRTLRNGKPGNQCVDIGGGTSPLRSTVIGSLNVETYWSLDVAPRDVTDIAADVCALPLATASVELILCTEVLTHVRDYEGAIAEMVRALKPGGRLIVTFPFIYGECDFTDFRRWTLMGMSDLLERAGCTVERAEPRGGAALATMACWMSAVHNMIPGGRRSWRAERSLGGYFREVLINILEFPLVILAWLAVGLDGILPRSGLYTGGIVFATKAEASNG